MLTVPMPSTAPSLAPNIPVPATSVEATVNPSHLPPYSGPAGAVEGTVHIKGDPPPLSDAKVTKACAPAEDFYRTLFRVGPDGTLADAMVAVTEFKGYVPEREPAVRVNVKDCAFDHRTVVATFGQRVEVFNVDDKNPYLPYLIGESAPAHMVAMPHGDPVRLYPLGVGRFLLSDEMNRPWMKAEVFVLKYATHAVTGLDGRYRIEGIPVGSVKVSAYLPQAELVSNSAATVEEGKTATVDFDLTYKPPPPKQPPKPKPQPTVR